MLSSDDEEIIEVALKYGAKAPFVRDKNLSDDYASSTAVVQNAIEFYKAKIKFMVMSVVFMLLLLC